MFSGGIERDQWNEMGKSDKNMNPLGIFFTCFIITY